MALLGRFPRSSRGARERRPLQLVVTHCASHPVILVRSPERDAANWFVDPISRVDRVDQHRLHRRHDVRDGRQRAKGALTGCI